MHVLKRPAGAAGIGTPWALTVARAGGFCQVQHARGGVMVRCDRRAEDVVQDGRELTAYCTSCRRALGIYSPEEKTEQRAAFVARQLSLFGAKGVAVVECTSDLTRDSGRAG